MRQKDFCKDIRNSFLFQFLIGAMRHAFFVNISIPVLTFQFLIGAMRRGYMNLLKLALQGFNSL